MRSAGSLTCRAYFVPEIGAMRDAESVIGNCEGQPWAFVIAPGEAGWEVKCLPNGAPLARGGGRAEDLQEALENVRVLAELLVRDELTGTLLVSEKREVEKPSSYRRAG